MESFDLLLGGFAIALTPTNLGFAFAGCMLGTMVGVLPGFGPSAGTAVLVPMTFALDPTSAIIMLAAIYYGAMYGGTITSVLLNTPGEAASAITCLDGYQMAKKGRSGPALAIAAIGSFVGGAIAMLGLVLVALPLARLALHFGPTEFFALMCLGLSLVTGLASRSLVRGLISAVIGLLLATVGIDPVAGAQRFTFGQAELLGGLNFVPIVMGLFGISEILINVENRREEVFDTRMRTLVPTSRDLRQSAWPIVRGTGIGALFGFIPGVGAVVPSFMSYAAEKKISATPERFGTGAIEGVAGPETANNAYVISALIPLLTLGIPGSATMAILMGALMMNGLTPGPFLFVQHADFVWAVIASLFVGNVMLLILNLPLIPMWVMILKIPYGILSALILGFCVVGAYSLNGSAFDIGIMLAAGILGYAFRKLDIPLAPLALTLILGPLMEQGLRLSLELSRGDFTVFFTRPISGTLMALAAVFMISSAFEIGSRFRGSDTEV